MSMMRIVFSASIAFFLMPAKTHTSCRFGTFSAFISNFHFISIIISKDATPSHIDYECESHDGFHRSTKICSTQTSIMVGRGLHFSNYHTVKWCKDALCQLPFTSTHIIWDRLQMRLGWRTLLWQVDSFEMVYTGTIWKLLSFKRICKVNWARYI